MQPKPKTIGQVFFRRQSTVFTFSENFADLTVILTCAASIVFDWENDEEGEDCIRKHRNLEGETMCERVNED